MTSPVEKWAEQVRAGDVRAVSRAITAIENHQPEAEALLRLLFPHTGQAYLTGVTGAPGVIWARSGNPSVSRQRTSHSNLVMLTQGSRQEFLCAAVAIVKAAPPSQNVYSPAGPARDGCGRRIR